MTERPICPDCGVAIDVVEVGEQKRALCPSCNILYEDIDVTGLEPVAGPFEPAVTSGESSPLLEPGVTTATGAEFFADVKRQVEILDRAQGNPWTKLGWFVLSVAVFFVLASAFSAVTFAVVLMIVLFIHEMGHLIGMKVYGHRDVRIFFIPMLGAAASGRPTRANAFENGIIALLGPAPGFLLGVFALILFVLTSMYSKSLLLFALVAIFVNAFNLLPLFPLDGARVIDAALLGHSPKGRVIFQSITTLILAGLAAVSGWWVIAAFAVVLALRIPMARRTANAVRHFKLEFAGRETELPCDIPEDDLNRITSFLVQGLARNLRQPKVVAGMVREVWDSVRTTSPTERQTTLLLTAYGLLFVLTVGLWILIYGSRGFIKA